MFRLYSKGCEYALRALTQVSLLSSSHTFQAKQLCQQAGIPESFTRKIFQSLVQSGLLRATRGPRGGYSLSKDPGDLSLLRIIKSVDGEDTFSRCVMGLPECSTTKPCPIHKVWFGAKQGLLNKLESSTLKDLMGTMENRTEALQTMEEGCVGK